LKIQARIHSVAGAPATAPMVEVSTAGVRRGLPLPPKAEGRGADVNGGGLLCLAIATCYCNDLYREAGKQGIEVRRVDVEAHAEFGGVGDPAHVLRYEAKVEARADEEVILTLMAHTDRVAEVHNTLRKGMEVTLVAARAVPWTGR